MEKKSKKVKHYFTLKDDLNEKFMNYINDNYINKQKIIEGLIIQYLRKNNINIDD